MCSQIIVSKKKLKFFKHIALGLNDSKTYLYRDSINEMWHSKIFKLNNVIDWLKSFLIAPLEKKYLSLANVVHVQTQNESNKVKKLLSSSANISQIVV